MPTTWNTLDFCLVRIESDNGLVGWGEAFGYFCSRSVAAIIERSIAPLLVGKEVGDPRGYSEEIQRKLVLQGRYGITTFALSGVDIGLWDLWAKSQGVSVAMLISENQRQSIPAYIQPEVWLYDQMPTPNRGVIQIPTGPGLGVDPNLDTMNRYLVT